MTEQARVNEQLGGRTVFLSASIPDPARWDGEYDALEITDAVVAITRTVLMQGGRLATAAHPTIAPLLLYVAAEQSLTEDPRIVIYQSATFDEILPEATTRFEAEGIGAVVRTAAVGDEPADPARAPKSLEHMRRQMLNDESPIAAIFIGGMVGIPVEHALFRELCQGTPTYALGYPGGAARQLVDESPHELITDLLSAHIYPSISRRIVDDIAGRYRDRLPVE